VNCSSCCEPRA